jgi:cell division protein FtsZ
LNTKKSKAVGESNHDSNQKKGDSDKNNIDVNNLEVDFEIVNASEEDMEVLEGPNSEDETNSEGMLNFDFSKDEDESPSSRSNKSSRDIEVNKAEEVNSYHEKTNRDIKRYDLSEFMKEEEDYKLSLKPQKRNEVKNANESDDTNFSKRTAKSSRPFEPTSESNEVDPMNTTLSELASRAAERKTKMKQFNYKFRNTSNIDEIEKQPAYKRAGIELDHNQSQGKDLSRTSVEGGKGNLNFRSNNSFLHDNVD